MKRKKKIKRVLLYKATILPYDTLPYNNFLKCYNGSPNKVLIKVYSDQ